MSIEFLSASSLFSVKEKKKRTVRAWKVVWILWGEKKKFFDKLTDTWLLKNSMGPDRPVFDYIRGSPVHTQTWGHYIRTYSDINKVWLSPFSHQTVCQPRSELTFCHPVGVNAGCVATWTMPRRPFDSCTFLDTTWTWKQSTPRCTCAAFQRLGGRHHMVNYSFIFPLAAIAIRQGFACIIIGFDMDEAPLRFVYYQFFLWIMLPDSGLLWLQSDA